jgi:transmembrane sensor
MRYGAYDIDRLAAWRDGRWIAEDMPLEELLAKITPLIADETYVLDPLLDDVYVTGSFDLSKPQSAIAAVLGAYALKKQSFPGGFEIISKK